MNEDLRSTMISLTNEMGGVGESKAQGQGGGSGGTIGGGIQSVEEKNSLSIGGENGSGGRPMKKKVENPYLEIDLIDPTDPILFEGEIQKYKPGFKATFIDRWVQVT
jgi:hypothetical protein